jgi:hypothetical protein
VDSQIGKLQLNQTSGCDFTIGQQLTLILKPAGVDLGQPNDGVQAKVLDCVFSGEMYRISLQAGEIIVKVLSRSPYEAGQVVGYHVHMDGIICLPQDEARA